MTNAIEPVAPEQLQQLITIEPAKYVDLVFEPFRSKLDKLKQDAASVTYDITTTAGMKTAVEWRAKFRDEVRLPTEATRKLRKAPILEIGKLLDSRAKEIAEEVEPFESRFDADIKAEEARKEAEKHERRRKPRRGPNKRRSGSKRSGLPMNMPTRCGAYRQRRMPPRLSASVASGFNLS